MIKFSGIFTLALACFFSGACSEQTPDEVFATAATAAADTSQADQAIQLFTDFVARYPEHELAAKALKHLAHITQQRGDN